MMVQGNNYYGEESFVPSRAMPNEDGVEDGTSPPNPPKRRKRTNTTASGGDGAERCFAATLANFMTLLLENSNKNLDVLALTLARHGRCARASGSSFGEGNGSTASKSDDDEEQMLMKCMGALNAVGLSKPLYAKAIKMLLGDKAFRKMFLMVPNDRKHDLIQYY